MDKQLIIYHGMRNGMIPVLHVNDYIINVATVYGAFKKEADLFSRKLPDFVPVKIKKKKKKLPILLTYKSPEIPTLSLDFPPEYREPGESCEFTMFSPRDMEFVHKELEGFELCVGNLLCGAGMLGIVLILSFCT